MSIEIYKCDILFGTTKELPWRRYSVNVEFYNEVRNWIGNAVEIKIGINGLCKKKEKFICTYLDELCNHFFFKKKTIYFSIKGHGNHFVTDIEAIKNIKIYKKVLFLSLISKFIFVLKYTFNLYIYVCKLIYQASKL